MMMAEDQRGLRAGGISDGGPRPGSGVSGGKAPAPASPPVQRASVFSEASGQ